MLPVAYIGSCVFGRNYSGIISIRFLFLPRQSNRLHCNHARNDLLKIKTLSILIEIINILCFDDFIGCAGGLFQILAVSCYNHDAAVAIRRSWVYSLDQCAISTYVSANKIGIDKISFKVLEGI